MKGNLSVVATGLCGIQKREGDGPLPGLLSQKNEAPEKHRGGKMQLNKSFDL